MTQSNGSSAGGPVPPPTLTRRQVLAGLAGIGLGVTTVAGCGRRGRARLHVPKTHRSTKSPGADG